MASAVSAGSKELPRDLCRTAKGVCCECPLSMNEMLKRGGEGDGPLGMELASNLNKMGGNLNLLWEAGIG